MVRRISTSLLLLSAATASMAAPFATQSEAILALRAGRTRPSTNDSDINPGWDYRATLDLAMNRSTHSWEFGTCMQAILEVYNPELSVYSPKAFPNGRIPKVDASKIQALTYLRPHIQLDNDTLVEGDGAAGDPASLGVGAIMIGQTVREYSAAATRQANHLLNVVPRYYNGAISQREAIAELWADQLSMTHPFLAYQAVATNNLTLLRYVALDIERQHQILVGNMTERGVGLWTHIVGPQSQTLGIWSTGNGWVALGIARVLATMKHWNKSRYITLSEQQRLRKIVYSLLGGLETAEVDTNGLYRNYLIGGADGFDIVEPPWFGEVSGTAALASAAYRLAVLDSDVNPRSRTQKLIGLADRARSALSDAIDSQTAIAAPAIDPLDWHSRVPYITGSPEGQSFVSNLGAAYRDCVLAKLCK
ncbi:hypothetical protein IE81DRAFT_323672 [Ceraceosorus guamensis]|uniref:Six-hairpin glycosidase n=1 Tax=Ceraceosorus guamensis TaxID=1522189 RepID=A0A316VXY8_9BASI|nr:hypothetical protein IE81DRAFT_323672 [Ceraceosorus guamensis]PWN42184.1 hypothetical protein IE81DRAFT_323672 [Ceraceosorus guamensis]